MGQLTTTMFMGVAVPGTRQSGAFRKAVGECDKQVPEKWDKKRR